MDRTLLSGLYSMDGNANRMAQVHQVARTMAGTVPRKDRKLR